MGYAVHNTSILWYACVVRCFVGGYHGGQRFGAMLLQFCAKLDRPLATWTRWQYFAFGLVLGVGGFDSEFSEACQ